MLALIRSMPDNMVTMPHPVFIEDLTEAVEPIAHGDERVLSALVGIIVQGQDSYYTPAGDSADLVVHLTRRVLAADQASYGLAAELRAGTDIFIDESRNPVASRLIGRVSLMVIWSRNTERQIGDEGIVDVFGMPILSRQAREGDPRHSNLLAFLNGEEIRAEP